MILPFASPFSKEIVTSLAQGNSFWERWDWHNYSCEGCLLIPDLRLPAPICTDRQSLACTMPSFAPLRAYCSSVMMSSSDKCGLRYQGSASGTELETPRDRRTGVSTRHHKAEFHLFRLAKKILETACKQQAQPAWAVRLGLLSFALDVLSCAGSTDNPAHGPEPRETGADVRLRVLPGPRPASHTGCIHSGLLDNTGLLV